MVTVRRRDNANRMEDTMTVSIAPPSRPSQAETRRAIWNTIRGSSGNLVEWYDVYVYTVFATYFEDQFFDRADRNSTVYVYAIFAVTFVTRPVGSWFLGRFADRRGRRAALTFSVSLMAACSLIVALVPVSLEHWRRCADPAYFVSARPGICDRRRVRHVGDVHV